VDLAVAEAARKKRSGKPNAADRILDSLLRTDHRMLRHENASVARVTAALHAGLREIDATLARDARRNGEVLTDWRRSRLRATREEIARAIQEAWGVASSGADRDIREYGWTAGLETQGLVPTDLANTIGFRFAAPSRDAIDEIVDTPYGGTAWGPRWRTAGVALVNATMATINQGHVQGESVAKMAARLRRTYAGNLGAARAEMIVRTESMRVLGAVRQKAYEENADVIKGQVYVATLDNRTCMVCAADDGKTYSSVRGFGDAPLASFPRLPRHPRCRCASAPIPLSARDLGWTPEQIAASPILQQLDGNRPRTVLYPDWMADQDDGFQNASMGKARADWFRAGTFDLSDMVDASGDRPASLASLYKRAR
jgi:SPP1 gp7 family putative phage head morphogenesis protein